MLEADLIEDAGRAAYLAAFHAAQALISERENRTRAEDLMSVSGPAEPGEENNKAMALPGTRQRRRP